MKRIDRETVQKILDTADIVEVVSDFVHLKRSGSGYKGLCPFHNERTPSFSVSKTKNLCKCFSCGKGGSPVNFIMEHEQLSFNEALRYLAKKYNIEIVEHEMTDKEREEETERESMLAVNEFALKHFEHNINETDDGRNIGLSYFIERGINESMIRRFHLGYALEKRNSLYESAIAKGYNEKYLIDTGLCIKNERGQVFDRFKGRVIYPVFSISGKVIAFGGRTLRKDKDVAKYVNSPESIIYRKSHELYGLYQAKQAIVKHDKCILVEGYMDVISMHQSGIENVVASSGTSLTEGQIRLIHRFTENVTVIYDGDAAGIKAALRGIDMLLAEGLSVRVLLLPDGDDPDSFAQKHSATEFEEYIKNNETDFISFKTKILLDEAGNDPLTRSRVINDIVRTISVIPDSITRSVYVRECSRSLEIDERTLSLQVAKYTKDRIEKESEKALRDKNRKELDSVDIDSFTPSTQKAAETTTKTESDNYDRFLLPFEKEVLRYVLKYGLLNFCESIDQEGNTGYISVLEYIDNSLKEDDISFTSRLLAKVYSEAQRIATSDYTLALERHSSAAAARRQEYINAGEMHLRSSVNDVAEIQRKEKELLALADERYFTDIADFSADYIEKALINHPDDNIRSLTLDLVSEKHTLSKVHTKYAHIETERERLIELVPRAVFELKDAILDCQIREIRAAIKQQESNPVAVQSLMARNIELQQLKREFAIYLGDRTISPRKK